ncbi:hypothetical protein DL764_007779 [Monosporascus ibericus]|uniref:HOOK N-terminal domain-containing protein n=1 Tax=Monosporascus ibericus TaxID=155417 RepID=A0A4Q4T1C3_9PEZI|nr:hypothetical protein DL764_007779 [Monosporascus ibericus]
MLSKLNNPATQAALLGWADKMLVELAPRDTDLKCKRAEQLYDGAVFSVLLEILDDEYNPSRLQQALETPPSNTDDHRPRNLHIIHMALNDYARRKCPKIEPLIRSIDFQALGRHPTKLGMAEILTVFLLASAWNEDADTERGLRPIQLMRTLNQHQQMAIMTIIQDVDAKVKQDAETSDVDNDTGATSANVDEDLAQEAEIARLRYEADDARRQAGGLKMRLDRLQDNYDELVRKHEDLQNENEDLQKQINNELGNFDKHRLQRQLRENEALIASLENQRNDLVDQKERLEREKARLEVQVQKAEHLADENQELRSKNEELSKKANTADNLRKKVEAYRPMEIELKALQNDKVDVMKAYSELEKANTRISMMRQEQEAYATKMEGYEIEIAGFRDEKQFWRGENTQLKLRIQQLEQQALSDEQTVRDLQDKVQMLDPSAVPDTPTAARPSHSLEDELRDSGGSVSMRDIEIQRLQAENALLRGSIGTEGAKDLLLQELEETRASRQQLQDKYNEMLEKYTVGQAQIDALILNMGGEGLVGAIDACHGLDPRMKVLMSDYFRDDAYSNLRTQVLAEQNASKDLRRQLEAARQALSDKERELLQARGDCKIILAELLLNDEDADDEDKVNAVEKSSQEALEELKKTDGMIAVSLRAELDAERKKSRSLKEEGDNFQKQLLTAFIEKDQLRREAEEANRQLQAAADGQTPSTEFIKQGEKFEKLRVKAKELKEVSASKSSTPVTANPPPSIVLPRSPRGSPESPISDWSDDDEDDPDAEDDDGIGGMKVDVKRRSVWDVLMPRLSWGQGQTPQRPQWGFHPYRIDGNGSFGFPRRPVSAAALPGGSATVGGSSPRSLSRQRTSLESVSLSPPPFPKSCGIEQATTATGKRLGGCVADWLISHQQQYDKLELKNRELERTLKAVRAGTEAGAQKAQSDQIIKNLQRENALIATAWYDLNSRLQSSHFILQRRQDAPKSWLNKQRALVNGESSLFYS